VIEHEELHILKEKMNEGAFTLAQSQTIKSDSKSPIGANNSSYQQVDNKDHDQANQFQVKVKPTIN